MDQDYRSSSEPPSTASYALQDNELLLEQDLRACERRDFEDAGCKPHFITLWKFRNAIFRQLKCRLSQNGIRTDRLTPQLVKYCLPTSVDSVSWDRLLQQPLSLPDHILVTMFKLDEDTGCSESTNTSDTTMYYLRSFSMSVTQLRELIADWKLNGHEYEEATTWTNMVTFLQPNDVVFIRYIGASNKKIPFRRHREDMLMRSHGLLARFLTTIGRLFPVVLDCCTVYEFSEARQEDCAQWKKGDSIEDLPEQTLIALFGLPVLLNQDIGGFGHTCLEDDSQRPLFQSLQTNVSVTMAALHLAPSDLRDQLKNWVAEICKYALEYRLSVTTIGKTTHNFSDALSSTVLKQATSALYNGKGSLFVTVGSGVSKAGFLNAEPFYAGPSSSANLMRTLFSRLLSWEIKTNNVSSHNVDQLIEAGAFLFVDLCPWLKAEGKDLAAAIESLGRYIGITQPYVILTLSKKPSSVVASDFRHAVGYPERDRFWDKVGILRLVHYQGVCSIQIPCFHPGQTIVDSRPYLALETRKSVCDHIKTRVERILKSKGIDVLLNKAKEELQEAQREARNNFNNQPVVSTKDGRAGLAIASNKFVDRAIFSEFAVGKEYSNDRRQQVHRLWNFNIPELHAQITRNHWYAWYVWAHELSEGMSFFANVIISAHWYNRIKLDLGKVMADPKKMVRVDLHDLLGQKQVLRIQPITSTKSKKRSTPVEELPDSDNDLCLIRPVISTKRKKSPTLVEKPSDSDGDLSPLIVGQQLIVIASIGSGFELDQQRGSIRYQVDDTEDMLSTINEKSLHSDDDMSSSMPDQKAPNTTQSAGEKNPQQRDFFEYQLSEEKDIKESVPSEGSADGSDVVNVYGEGLPTRVCGQKPVTRGKLQGTEVYVSKALELIISWEKTTGEIYNFSLRTPSSGLQESENDERYIFFTKDGIDLRREDGTSCLVQKRALGSDNTVTFTALRLLNSQTSRPLSIELVHLWEAETGLDWEKVVLGQTETQWLVPESGGSKDVHDLATTVAIRDAMDGFGIRDAQDEPWPADDFSGRGLKLIGVGRGEAKLVPYQGPLHPSDEIWLLSRFLNEQWPHGGTLFAADPQKWPERKDNIWPLLLQFLSQRRWINHPRILHLKAWTQDFTHPRLTSQLITNVRHLREVREQKKIQKRNYDDIKLAGKDVRLAGTQLLIGPRKDAE